MSVYYSLDQIVRPLDRLIDVFERGKPLPLLVVRFLPATFCDDWAWRGLPY